VSDVVVVGGGLAGAEAAWQAARRGARVRLYEMRPRRLTPAHRTGWLAELVCSNSLKSSRLDDASGLLQAELRRLGSLILEAADAARVPAGSALAVDRELFARGVTRRVAAEPRIRLETAEVRAVPPARPVVIATGPLTSDALAADLAGRFAAWLGEAAAPGALLAFYDAISPIVSAESIRREAVYLASRYGKGEAAYLNCPMTAGEHAAFREALIQAELYPLHPFEAIPFFEACLPIEEIARRGQDAMRFGPLRPVGLEDPRTGQRPHAVVQLRVEDRAGSMYNLVGFQTRLRWPEQRRVFRMIPGLEAAEFLRYGMIHRNTFVRSPRLLEATLACRADQGLFLAGQLVGVEGYLESAAAGLLAGLNAARLAAGERPVIPPAVTAIGALVRYITQADPDRFQPMNINFGLFPPVGEGWRTKADRRRAIVERALRELDGWIRLAA
jgi:methylenetetrahydrofolate--tRNA-(uracil-5-)-methyltransferase